MDTNRESIFRSALRAFVVTIFAILGLCVGLIIFLMFIGGIGSVGSNDIEQDYKLTVLPNSEGVRKMQSSSAPVILQLNIQGVIGTPKLTTQHIREQLVESREGKLKDNRVKGILLNLSSPGGTVIDADGIYQAIKEYKEQYKIPVYVYVDGLCASGGMYIACASDKIYASDVSLIGSVGTLLPTFVNVSETLDKIGVKTLSLTAGIGKDDLNPLRPWKEGESDNFRHLVDYYYADFVNVVVSNRDRVNRDKLISEYGAHVFPASQAQEIGFIDIVSKSRRQALADLVKAAGIEDDKYQVFQMESKNWFSELLKEESPLFTGKVKHQVQIGNELDAELAGKFLYLYRPDMN